MEEKSESKEEILNEEENISTKEKFLNFIKNKKNLTIIIVSFLLLCSFANIGNSTEYENKIKELETKINSQSTDFE